MLVMHIEDIVVHVSVILYRFNYHGVTSYRWYSCDVYVYPVQITACLESCEYCFNFVHRMVNFKQVFHCDSERHAFTDANGCKFASSWYHRELIALPYFCRVFARGIIPIPSDKKTDTSKHKLPHSKKLVHTISQTMWYTQCSHVRSNTMSWSVNL